MRPLVDRSEAHRDRSLRRVRRSRRAGEEEGEGVEEEGEGVKEEGDGRGGSYIHLSTSHSHQRQVGLAYCIMCLSEA